MKPIVIINFKTYKAGKEELKLAKEVEKVNRNIIVGVQASSISQITKNTKLIVFAQHVDPYEQGRNTGFILPESVKGAGAQGTFLNHSEHKLDLETIDKTIKRCKKIKLKTAVFAKDLDEARKIVEMCPDFLIIEPPELVAGNISVSSAKPELIKEIANKIKMPFLVGAGIKTNEDLKLALKLGAGGIAVSSAITLAQNPRKALLELIK